MHGRWRGRRTALVRIVAALAMAAMAAVVLLPLLDTQQPQLSAYSEGWNDLSEFREMLKSRQIACRTILTGPMELSGEKGVGRLLVVIGVEKAYTVEERAQIASFLHSGGSMLVADDFGQGGPLVSAITGGLATIKTECLRDLTYLKNPDFLVVRSRSGGFVRQPSHQLVLNRPAALEGFPSVSSPYNWEVLINASPHAWLDTNRNLVRDAGEGEYPYAVVTHFTIGGSGGIVLASDPGMFVNDMMRWNADYIGDLLDRMKVNPTAISEAIFDESRHTPESAAGKLGTGLLRLAAGYSVNPLALISTFIFGMLVFGYQYRSLPSWGVRRHRDVLDRPRLLHFASPYVSIHEFRRLRVAIVERVRLAYGYSPEEFYPAMLPNLPGLLRDIWLQAFLENETYPDTGSFQTALHMALAWRPPQQPIDNGGAAMAAPRDGYNDGAAPTTDIRYEDVELVEDAQAARFPVDSILYGGAPLGAGSCRESRTPPGKGGGAP